MKHVEVLSFPNFQSAYVGLSDSFSDQAKFVSGFILLVFNRPKPPLTSQLKRGKLLMSKTIPLKRLIVQM